MFRKLVAVPVIGLLFVLGGCAGAKSAQVSASLGARSLPAINPPPYIPGPLNGESTLRSVALRRPLAVMIENYYPDSRPQSGLSRASTVIETLAEDGITRFMAIYLERNASKVGPVRSTRMYFDRWASGFHAILAHVGGNDDAQALLWHLPPVFNLDENRWEVSLTNTGTPLFWRSQDRVAPHNMYVSTFKLRSYAAQHGQDWTYSQAYFQHKPANALRARGRSGSISVDFTNPLNPQPNPYYVARYQFDRATDTYLRFMGGAPHVDVLTGRSIRPANVVIMRTDAAVADPFAGIATPQSILIRTLGSGPAWLFRDGKVFPGTWHQKDQFAPLRFVDTRGRPFLFNPGQTWIEMAPLGSNVSWSFR